MAETCDILVTGTGSFAERLIFDIAITAEKPVTVAVSGRNEARMDWLSTAGNARAALFGHPVTVLARPVVWDSAETIAEVIGRGTMAYWTWLGVLLGKFYPLLVLSPSVAEVIAKDGWTKDDVRQYMHQHVKVRAGLLEKLAWQGGGWTLSLYEAAEQGIAPKEYCESTDPDRMVPVFPRPDWIGIVVSGDPGRNQSKGYVQNHVQGPPISKKIELPRKWEQLLRKRT